MFRTIQRDMEIMTNIGHHYKDKVQSRSANCQRKQTSFSKKDEGFTKLV